MGLQRVGHDWATEQTTNDLGGLNNRNLFSNTFGGWKSEIRVLAWKILFLACRWLPSCCVLMWPLFRACSWKDEVSKPFDVSSQKGANLHWKDSTLKVSPNPHDLSKVPFQMSSRAIVQLLSHVWFPESPWTAACQASLSCNISQSLLKIMPIDLVMPSNHLILCHPLLFLPSILPSIRVFSNESTLHIRWPKYWSFSNSIIPSIEYSGWSPCSPSDSQESSSTPQFKSFKSSVFNLYGPTFTSIYDYWKAIALTRWTFVGKVMSLLFNMLFRFVIAFLPRSKRLLILWLQSPSAVILSVGKSDVSCGFFIDVLCQIGEITFYF